MEKLSKAEFRIFLLIIILLILVTLLTRFEGGADTFDYTDTAKFFAGEYSAKIRTSHSYLYGLIHSPFVGLFKSFWIFKITSLASLLLIIYSVYIMGEKDKRALWLMVLSPIVWYIAPWASPIQLSSLLFLWGWYFIRAWDKKLKKNVLYLFYSGILIGLSWAFWDGILFFIPLIAISFLYDKKLIHIFYFIIFILIGALPKLILDQILFGFAFFTTVRHVMASLTLTFLGGFYSQGGLWGITNFILLIIFFPIFTYLIFKKNTFKENKKSVIFVSLSIILLILNSQIRFVLLIVPIIILIINKYLTHKKFIAQITFSFILILLVLNPYVLQIKWDVGNNDKGIEFTHFIKNIDNINLNGFDKDAIRNDLADISKDYPNESFIVGNYPDSYRILASFYWGNNVKEFVSIEDYNLHTRNDSIIAIRELCSNVKIKERRDVCISIWIRKAFNDSTNYNAIKYAISEEENLNLEDFKLIKRYRYLSLFEKI
ncbi:MAG: EpsG family protein [Nanoarchaeota archaeon]